MNNNTSLDNHLPVDRALENILIAYFPREIKEKDQDELKEIYQVLPQKQDSMTLMKSFLPILSSVNLFKGKKSKSRPYVP
jgi:hypothetical protein